MKKVIVISPFRDKNNFDIRFEPGDDVSHFEKDRIDHLLEHGHAEEMEVSEESRDTTDDKPKSKKVKK